MEYLPKAIKTILENDATVVVAMGGTGQIWHSRVPQDLDRTKMALRYYVTNTSPISRKNAATRMFNVFVTIEIYVPLIREDADADLVNAAKAVREALDRYPHGVVNTVNIQGVQYLDGGYHPDDPDIIDMSCYMQSYKFRVVDSDVPV